MKRITVIIVVVFLLLQILPASAAETQATMLNGATILVNYIMRLSLYGWADEDVEQEYSIDSVKYGDLILYGDLGQAPKGIVYKFSTVDEDWAAKLCMVLYNIENDYGVTENGGDYYYVYILTYKDIVERLAKQETVEIGAYSFILTLIDDDLALFGELTP